MEAEAGGHSHKPKTPESPEADRQEGPSPGACRPALPTPHFGLWPTELGQDQFPF